MDINQQMNQLYNSYTKNQKLSIMTVLNLIGTTSDNDHNMSIREKSILNLTQELGLSVTEVDLFIEDLNPQNLKNELKSLTGLKKDLFISMCFQILTCVGRPSEKEYQVTVNLLNNIPEIDENTFIKTIDKLRAMGNHFTNY